MQVFTRRKRKRSHFNGPQKHVKIGAHGPDFGLRDDRSSARTGSSLQGIDEPIQVFVLAQFRTENRCTLFPEWLYSAAVAVALIVSAS
jgi:hypothetical protein